MSEAQSLERIKRTIEADADSVGGTTQPARPTNFHRPAVGIVASAGESADAARAHPPRHARGLPGVRRLPPQNVDYEAIEFAEQLGATNRGAEPRPLDGTSARAASASASAETAQYCRFARIGRRVRATVVEGTGRLEA